jgi:TldD protein
MGFFGDNMKYNGLTRREFLNMAAAGAGAIMLGPIVSGCRTTPRYPTSEFADRATLNMKDKLFSAVGKSTGQYADIRMIDSESINIAWGGSVDVDEYPSSKEVSGYARVFKDGYWGGCAVSSPDKAEEAMTQACADAEREKLKSNDEPEKCPEDLKPVDAIVKSRLKPAYHQISFREKLDLMAHYSGVGKEAGASGTWLQYSDRFHKAYFASSDNRFYMEERPRILLGITAYGKVPGRSARKWLATTTDFADLEQHDATIRDVSIAACRLDNAVPCKPGNYHLILDPMLAGVFLAHEGYGHLFEGASFFHFKHLKEMLALGTQIGVKGLNIIDDGTIPGVPGSQVFDDEGTPSQKTYVIRDGKVHSYMHSLQTAADMGHKPTGNGRTLWPWQFPFSGMTNTYVDSGDATFDELLSGIKNGIYCCGCIGLNHTTRNTFYARAVYGYPIVNGEPAIDKPVTGIRLEGAILETLHKIEGIEKSTMSKMLGLGFCSGGRVVGMGSPHIRLRDIKVIEG